MSIAVDWTTLWARVSPWEGWLREEQARALWEGAQRVPDDGQIVEIGSYHGKSTAVLASAAPAGATVVAIDPHTGDDRAPGLWKGTEEMGVADHDRFVGNLEAAGVTDRVRHVREFSQAAQPQVAGVVDLLYVDGAHGYAPASSDIVEWGGRVGPGGEMFIHDVYNSVFVTLAVLRHLSCSRRWRYLGRYQSLAHYRRENVGVRGMGANLAGHLASMPWFARNLFVKVLRKLGLERFGRVVGYRPGDGCY